MAWRFLGRTLEKIGIVGSGRIGPDIALYFAKVLSPFGVRIVVSDVSADALDRGRAKLRKKVERGVQTGAFKQKAAEEMLAGVDFTAEKTPLAGAGLVIEAASEDLGIKRSIFRELAALCPEEAILASNSSHLEPEAIFEGLPHPGRALVHHFFFPAERNPVVEIVPGRETAPAVVEFCLRFYEAIGKVPVRVGSRYGYAIDPIFEGLFLAALKMADAGLASPKAIDAVAQEALGLGVGPFAAMNLTGGTPLTRVGLSHYHEKISPWFEVPESLRERTEPWPAPAKGETVEVDKETHREVARRLQGAYFGLAAEVVESGVSTVSDLDMAVELALVMRPPFTMMNEIGLPQALRLVEDYARENPGFEVAGILRRTDPWPIHHLLREDDGDIAVVTIRRPKTLNALDRSVYAELRDIFDGVRRDSKIRGAVLTGFGTKAFVSGADIGMLQAVGSAEEGEALSWSSQEVMLFLERLGKPVVCALNGLALGGGSELAMACTARIARKGLAVCFGQPEPKLGIIPGAGATQRLPRLIGLHRAWEILRTGRPVSGAEALELGYLQQEVEGDLLERAVALARALAAETRRAPRTTERPVEVQATLLDLDIGPLSRKVDEILKRAILEGCARPLEEGLRLESRFFGEVCATQDKRIGIENFRRTQLKQPAPFVHA